MTTRPFLVSLFRTVSASVTALGIVLATAAVARAQQPAPAPAQQQAAPGLSSPRMPASSSTQSRPTRPRISKK